MGVSRIGYKVSHFLIPKIITVRHFSPVKIWQARPLWICLSVCLPICLSKTGGSLVPNQSLLQTESQSKTCTPGLWAETARPKDNSSKNLTTPKFDNSKIWHFQNLTTPKFDNSKIWQLQNLTPPKFDSAAVSSSQHRARRRDSIGKQIWKARNTKPIISL